MISRAMTRTVLTGLAATTLTVTAITSTPVAASAADTAVTFELSDGGLAVTAPASSTFGGVAAGGGTFSGKLGSVTVTDNRGALVSRSAPLLRRAPQRPW